MDEQQHQHRFKYQIIVELTMPHSTVDKDRTKHSECKKWDTETLTVSCSLHTTTTEHVMCKLQREKLLSRLFSKNTIINVIWIECWVVIQKEMCMQRRPKIFTNRKKKYWFVIGIAGERWSIWRRMVRLSTCSQLAFNWSECKIPRYASPLGGCFSQSRAKNSIELKSLKIGVRIRLRMITSIRTVWMHKHINNH